MPETVSIVIRSTGGDSTVRSFKDIEDAGKDLERALQSLDVSSLEGVDRVVASSNEGVIATTDAVHELSQALREVESAADIQTFADFDRLDASTLELIDSLANAQARLEVLQGQFTQTGVDAKAGILDAEEAVGGLQGSMDDARESLDRLGRASSLEGVAESMQETNARAEELGRTVSELQGTSDQVFIEMVDASSGATLGFVDVTKAAREFDQQMEAMLGTTEAGASATAEALNDLKTEAVSLENINPFGWALELAEVAERAGDAAVEVAHLGKAVTDYNGALNENGEYVIRVQTETKSLMDKIGALLILLGKVAIGHAIWDLLRSGVKRYGAAIVELTEGVGWFFGRFTRHFLENLGLWERMTVAATRLGHALAGTFTGRFLHALTDARKGAHNFTDLLHQMRVAAGLTNGKMIELSGALGKARENFVKLTRVGGVALRQFMNMVRVLTLLGIAVVVEGVAALIAKLGMVGAKVVPVTEAFENLAEHINTTAELLITDLRSATQETVSDLDLMKNAVLALNSGAIQSRADLAELSHAAFILGQTVGLDTTTAFNNLIRGIGLINPQMIKSIGVLVSAEVAYRKYADSVNKSVDSLSDEERHLAFRTEVMGKLREAVLRVDLSEKSLLVTSQQLRTQMKNAGIAFTSAIAGAQGLNDWMWNLRHVFSGFSQLAKGEWKDAIQGLTNEFYKLAEGVVLLIPGLNALWRMAEDAGRSQNYLDAVTASWRALGRATAEGVNEGLQEQIRALNAEIEDQVEVVEKLDRWWNRFLFLGMGEDSPIQQNITKLEKMLEALKNLTNQMEFSLLVAGRQEEEAAAWDAWLDPLERGADNMSFFADQVARAEQNMQNLRGQSMIAERIAGDPTLSKEDREKLIEQAKTLRANYEQAATSQQMFARLLRETLFFVQQDLALQNGVLETMVRQVEVESEGLDLMKGKVDWTLEYLGGLRGAETHWEGILFRMQKAREEADRLNEGIRQGMTEGWMGTSPIWEGGQVVGHRPMQFAGAFGDPRFQPAGFRQRLEDWQAAGISPFAAPFSAEGQGGQFLQSLQALAKLQVVQNEWSDVLNGNEEALEQLAETGGWTAAELQYLKDALGGVQDKSSQLAQQLVITAGGAIQAMIRGTDQLGQVMIQTAAQMLQASIAQTNPLAAVVVGTVGGIIGSLFGRRERQKVEVDRYGSEALRQQKQQIQQGPSHVTIQILDPSGKITSETHAELLRLERRDAVPRISDTRNVVVKS